MWRPDAGVSNGGRGERVTWLGGGWRLWLAAVSVWVCFSSSPSSGSVDVQTGVWGMLVQGVVCRRGVNECGWSFGGVRLQVQIPLPKILMEMR